jgi:hypothetical protein
MTNVNQCLGVEAGNVLVVERVIDAPPVAAWSNNSELSQHAYLMRDG